MTAKQDIWGEWLLKKRAGGEKISEKQLIERLVPIREQILEKSELKPGEKMLDVGCGDGLVGFGALEKQKNVQVTFCDVSEHLLDETKKIAQDAGVLDQCHFINNKAEDLKEIASESIDVVTTRSVLIYVSDKSVALKEFFRVLKKGGRISLFEPINSYFKKEDYPPNCYWGLFDVTPFKKTFEKIEKVRAKYTTQVAHDSMVNFNEKDLFLMAEKAGFSNIHLTLDVWLKNTQPDMSWEAFLEASPNPKAPKEREILEEALSEKEFREFSKYMKQLLDKKDTANERFAASYLKGVKG